MKRLLPLASLLLLSSLARAADPVPTFYTHASAEKLYQSAKYAQMEDLCKQAIATIEKSAGKNSPQLAPPLIDLATLYMRLAKYPDAKLVLDRAESVLDKTKPDQALLVARLGINKGWRLYTFGETAAAQKVFEESRDLLEKNLKLVPISAGGIDPKGELESVDLAEIINNLALMYEETAEENEDQAQSALARRMLLQSWQMRRKLTGEDSPQTAESLNNLGMHLLFHPTGAADLELALTTLKKALETALKAYGPDSPEVANAHSTMAMALFLTGQLDDAEREIKLALPITQRVLGVNHPDRASQLTTYGRILQEQADYDDAEKSFAEAVTINETTYGKSHPNVVNSLQNLKSFYDAKGEPVKSDQVQKRIEKLSGKAI